jgi:hypothetical protein
MWRESVKDGEDAWRGTIVQPLTKMQKNFCGQKELLAEVQGVIDSYPRSIKVD